MLRTFEFAGDWDEELYGPLQPDPLVTTARMDSAPLKEWLPRWRPVLQDAATEVSDVATRSFISLRQRERPGLGLYRGESGTWVEVVPTRTVLSWEDLGFAVGDTMELASVLKAADDATARRAINRLRDLLSLFHERRDDISYDSKEIYTSVSAYMFWRFPPSEMVHFARGILHAVVQRDSRATVDDVAEVARNSTPTLIMLARRSAEIGQASKYLRDDGEYYEPRHFQWRTTPQGKSMLIYAGPLEGIHVGPRAAGQKAIMCPGAVGERSATHLLWEQVIEIARSNWQFWPRDLSPAKSVVDDTPTAGMYLG